jgi:hypothetical protein
MRHPRAIHPHTIGGNYKEFGGNYRKLAPMNDATQLLTMNDATQAYLACAELDCGGVEGGEALREGG